DEVADDSSLQVGDRRVQEFTSEVLDTLSNEHELEGLHLETKPKPEFLNTPITDLKGDVIGYLVWPSKAPGTAVFHQVY
ncbi:hypothetical protein ACC734_39790, partial [Rhizobium ruizarguesonis]